MKQVLLYVLLIAVVLAAGGWLWYSLGKAEPGRPIDGYPVVCPHCDHFFVIASDEAYAYPRSPQGEGFKCPACGRYGANVAVQCDRCKRWYVPSERSGAASCPRCPSQTPARSQGP